MDAWTPERLKDMRQRSLFIGLILMVLMGVGVFTLFTSDADTADKVRLFVVGLFLGLGTLTTGALAGVSGMLAAYLEEKPHGRR